MTTWPGAIPQKPLLGAFSSMPDDERGVSDLGLGQPTLRERTTSSGAEVAAVFGMNAADLTTFTTFHDTTLNNGAGSFTWDHPIDGTSRNYTFLEPPSIQAASDGFFRVSVKLYQEAT